MKQRLMRWFWGIVMVLLTPAMAVAQSQEELPESRLQGYSVSVTVDSAPGVINWLLILFLTAITVAVLFKNAKRTHLD
jgi:hypothetical protein